MPRKLSAVRRHEPFSARTGEVCLLPHQPPYVSSSSPSVMPPGAFFLTQLALSGTLHRIRCAHDDQVDTAISRGG
jgi:hypothetical protein